MIGTSSKPRTLIKIGRTSGKSTLLASLFFAKSADLGGDVEGGFEQAFASLAYSHISDKAPRLIDYMIGFQLVDRSEDQTKAMGVFGFKVGDQWLYAPVFFQSGDLKGHELLYVKNQDAFVPLKENWINHLISRKPHMLGQASPKDTHQLGGMPADIYRLTHPPTSSKYGSDSSFDPRRPVAWAVPFMRYAAAASHKQAAALYRDIRATGTKFALDQIVERPLVAAAATVAASFDLRDFLTSDFRLLKQAWELTRQYPRIKEGFALFYGPDFFLEAGRLVQQRQRSLLDQPATPVKQAAAATSGSLIPEPPPVPHPCATGALQIITRDPWAAAPAATLLDDALKTAAAQERQRKVDPDAPGGITYSLDYLSESERSRLAKDTVLIKDKRDPHAVSAVYNTQVLVKLINPGETGIYGVLERKGTFDEMLVVLHPHTNRGREKFAMAIRLSAPRNWLNIHASRLWAKADGEPERPTFTSWWKKQTSAELKKNGIYVAVGENGDATAPFLVRETYEDGTLRVDFKDHCSWDRGRPEWLPATMAGNQYDSGPGWISAYNAIVHYETHRGTKLRSLRGELFIPSSFKCLELKAPPPPPKKKDKDVIEQSYPSFWDDDGSADKPINPGDLADIQLMLHEKTAGLKLVIDGPDVWLHSDCYPAARLSKTAALISLVRDHGTSEAAARDMLDAAALVKKAEFRIKYAEPFGGPTQNSMLQGGPGMPPFPAPQIGMERAGLNTYPAIYPQEEFHLLPELLSGKTDPIIYDPFYQPDQRALQAAQEAAQSGQKEIFDTSMITGLLNSVRQDSLVDRYLGPLMKALDAYGRLLFNFFQHQDVFEERYGKAEMPELEDSLRNTFENTGDVVLMLSKKSVSPLDSLSRSTAPDQAGPDVHEAAKA